MPILDSERLLTEETAREKRGEIVNVVLDNIKQVKAVDKGYGLRFSPDGESLLLLSDWIYVERLCNPFLRFVLKVESNNGPVWLEISGPAGTQDFLKSEFALNRWL